MKKLFLVAILLFPLLLVACSNTSNNSSDLQIIDDVTQYSRITEQDLKTLIGEPLEEESWTNKTSKGNFNVKTISYDKNYIHYEFIIADDSVVRLTMYSNQYWNDEGELFSYKGNKQDILNIFGIQKGSNTKIVTDNGFTYKLSPVNDKIAIFDVQELDSTNKTFGFVKMTYNLNYFD